MIVNRRSVDYAALPTALLPAAKAWMRVDHTDDDTLIAAIIARAMDHLEKISNQNIFEAEFDVLPTPRDRPRVPWPPYSALPPGADRVSLVRLPHFPVGDIATFEGAGDAVPYTGTEVVEDPDYGPVWVEYPTPEGSGYRYTAGYSDATALPPSIVNYVLRLSASLYENREASIDLMGEGFAAEFLPTWRPST